MRTDVELPRALGEDPGSEARHVERLRNLQMKATLQRIARGRLDNGRPLAAETVRQAARNLLQEMGERW